MKQSTAPFVGVVAAIVVVLAPAASQAQCPPVAKLVAADGGPADELGRSVSISGPSGSEVAIVGARAEDHNGSNAGAAYIYRRSGSVWTEEQELLAADGVSGDEFGRAVCVSGDVAIVSAHGDDDNGVLSGSVYIFRFDGAAWVQEQKLTASDGAAGDFFGFAVCVDGDVAVVGAERDDGAGLDQGSAYIFRFNGASWVQEQKLVSSDATEFDHFGRAVGLDGNTAIIGAWGDDDGGAESGSAYVYRFDGASWLQEQKLLATDATAGDRAGRSVGIDADVAVVGAWKDDDRGADSGSAYIHRFDGASWVQEAKLLASDGAAGDLFGQAVAVRGDVTMVGAFRNDGDGNDAGSAYAYRYDGAAWIEQRLFANDAAIDDRFGRSVAITDDPGNEMAIVGSYRDDDRGTDSGSAYVFDLTCPASTPATLTDVTRTLGIFVSGGVPELLASDDTYYVLQSGPGFNPAEPHPARMDCGFDTGGFAASSLDVTIEEKANIGGPTAVLLLRNWTSGQWDELGRQGLTPFDQTISFPGIAAGDYISGTNRVEVRVRSFAILILNPTVRGIFSHDLVGVAMR